MQNFEHRTFTLKQETNYDGIIKCDPLYEKIVIVLNSGVQEKITIAINLICALLYINDKGQTRKKSLHIYAQNMIRVSGILTSMTNLFISFMMHQDTLKAVCRGISEACRECSINQTFCSHIVPLCIRRCRGGSSDMFIVLQSLLSNHSRNMKLFHENNGMKIFTRESLQHSFCLQLLNTVVENTTNENHPVVSESSHIFEHLRYFLHRYGASNLIGQWVSIILFSYQKVLRKFGKENNNIIGIDGSTRKGKAEESHPSRHVVRNNKQNDTNVLFRNILKELIGTQSINYGRNRNTARKNNYDINFNKNTQYGPAYDTTIDEKEILRGNTRPIVNYDNLDEPIPAANNDLSFSFLFKAHQKQSLENKRCETLSCVPDSIRKKNINNNLVDLPCCNQTANNFTQSMPKIGDPLLTQEEDKDSTFYFAPPFVSTPKRNAKAFKSNSISQSSGTSVMTSAATQRQCHIKTRTNKIKNIKRTSDNKKIQNKTIGAKFIDIINGSCTTLVKSYTSFKNIFRNKEPSTCKDVSTSTTAVSTFCSNSFTNYMRKRDATSNYFDENENKTQLKREFSGEDNLSSCKTCNDTIALKQKLTNDAKLQQTVKRLKFGINMYGCDFKKISRTMWPNEHYMTPSVLYNLYRKLIIK
ncbi:uncharacterized protein LOC113392600 [Vanessa tameamea]|uniref:Uncharacterized protein LOC113392600 n=1 Tax=Vanessa tameamea TaxID=334116 RepID=A0ABM4AZZ2_VANTA